MNQSDKIIGIDLGTTNSVLAVIQDGLPVLLPVNGERLLPSVVGIAPNGEVVVGSPARNQWVVAPERTVRSIKRKMGRVETVDMAGQTYTPQEISAFILKNMREAAQAVLGEGVRRAVITVPAYFDETQRQATLEAGEIAGLIVERIINEPTASALAYGYGLAGDQHLKVLVYDLGGGTFDVSIIELHSGVVDVLATAGDNLLGGDDFDERLAAMLADEFAEEHDIDLRQHHQAWARLLRAAEEAKIELSSAPFAEIKLEYIFTRDRKGYPLHIQREVARPEFEELIADLLGRTITLVRKALEDAKLRPNDIERVLLVGGSTRIPAVWELIVAQMGQEPHIEIDPDAAVALGAAVQAGIIAGEEIDAILVDVTPYSLGIETAQVGYGGRLYADLFTPLVRRNTTVPVQKSQMFTTIVPGQEQIRINVYQGENPTASQNVLLGDFMIEGLKPNRPDGLSEVTVNFQLDVNGILDVTVVERRSGKRVSEQLKASRQRLSPDDIARSQAKLAAVYTGIEADDEAAFDPGVAALLDRARKTLEQPDLSAGLADDIAGAVANIRHAVAEEDDAQVEAYCDELIDLLMEVEG